MPMIMSLYKDAHMNPEGYEPLIFYEVIHEFGHCYEGG